ncbi:hypothetical protein ES332_D09G113700v1 [Gossypium tomentosum]|uniref:Uncharacterized protein n=1 Tax=Gossypium tomentosum TaxID=34277 RepID=A0A5D2JG41_GOSTO|nr:hypothetical protein ES332_D09G113700v1 [Gossypium tomentosum]
MAQEGLSRGEDGYWVEDAPALNCWFSSKGCEDLRSDDSSSCLVALYPVLLMILFEQLSVGIPRLRDSF